MVRVASWSPVSVKITQFSCTGRKREVSKHYSCSRDIVKTHHTADVHFTVQNVFTVRLLCVFTATLEIHVLII